MTRIVLCYTDPLPQGQTWSLYGSLTLNGESLIGYGHLYVGHESVAPQLEAELCRIIAVPLPLNDVTSDWVLTIERMSKPGTEDRAEVIRRMQDQYGAVITALDTGGYMVESQGELEGEAFDEAFLRTVSEVQESILGPWIFTWNM